MSSKIPYGAGSYALPREAERLRVLEGRPGSPLAPEALRRSLCDPVAGPPLRKIVGAGESVLLVVPDASRCVQCGCCTYNCPIGIDVRSHAWRGKAIHDSHCLTCGECVKRCPRGVLTFQSIAPVKKGTR